MEANEVMDSSETEAFLPRPHGGGERDEVEDSASASTDSQRESHMAESGAESDVATERRPCSSNTRAYFTAGILCFINLLNYMDRYTIAGILVQVQDWFKIKDDNTKAGLLQSIFMCSYMVLAPVFGYMGDRFSRKYLMSFGILIWSATVYASTMMPEGAYWWFLALRSLVGIGEASFSTIAPTIIADLFVGDKRTKTLSFFYLAVPVGSGLGYVVGSQVSAACNNQWQWGMRVTPVLGIVGVLLCLMFVHEPRRGAIERGEDVETSVSVANAQPTSSYCEDLAFIFKCKSFIWSTIASTCISFATGALGFWAPKALLFAAKIQDGDDVKEESVSYKFGIITCVGGIVGVWVGAELARRYRAYNRRADAIVCAFGCVFCTIFLYGTLAISRINLTIAYGLMFITVILLCMDLAPLADILLYVIVPSRRSTAEAFQILILHSLGDVGSPYLIGVISDAIRDNVTTDLARGKSLEYALYISTFICIFGGFAFVMCALYVVGDRERAEKLTRGDRVSTGSSEFYSAIDDERLIGGDGPPPEEDGNRANSGQGRDSTTASGHSETDGIRV